MYQTDQATADRPYPWWRLVLQLCLIIAAAVMLLVRPHLVSAIRHNEVAAFWLLILPSLFLIIFLLLMAFDFFAKASSERAAIDYIQLAFGVFIIMQTFPPSLREYQVRRLPDVASIELIEKFAQNKDASLRALAILALSRHNLNNKNVGALIHRGLLDKDPLVQQAAKLVIEDNFGLDCEMVLRAFIKHKHLLKM